MKNNRNFGAFFPMEYVYFADEKEYWWRNHFRVSWYWDETNVKQVLSTAIGRRRKRHKSCSIAKYVTILGTLFEKTIKGTQRVLGDGYWDKLFSKFRASRFISERRISSIFMLIFFLPEDGLSAARNNHSLNGLLFLGCKRKNCTETKALNITRAVATLSFRHRIIQ